MGLLVRDGKGQETRITMVELTKMIQDLEDKGFDIVLELGNLIIRGD